MHLAVLKNFAPAARVKLQQQVAARLNYVLSTDTPELRQRAAQVQEIRTQLAAEGKESLVERVAYTWFNRLAALRFMDANGYHPFNLRVVTPNPGLVQPEILTAIRQGHFPPELNLNQQLINDLLDGRIPVANPESAVYRLLFVAVCNYYNGIMPFMFEKIADNTELLLPEDLLSGQSIVADFQQGIVDDQCAEVEIIGWLYQFYISEKKDEVMGRDEAVPKEDIPAVTQLFTPHWIVRYLVENSLGRLWLLNRPQSRLRDQMPYYIEGEPETDFLRINSPIEIKVADPAVGSGHMLTYAYDLLYAIYEEEGYNAPEIPALILKHNLHGIEICDRAAALAAFALFMKARGSDSRFFRRAVQPNVISLLEIRYAENELRDYISELNVGELFIQPVLTLLHQFEDAKNFGSLIQPVLDDPAIQQLRQAIESKDLGGQLFLRETHAKILRVLQQAEYLCKRYHVAVANPPYMGSNNFNASLKGLTVRDFNEGKADLYSCFLLRDLKLIFSRGFSAMITLPNWMFLGSWEKLRKRVLTELFLPSLIHNGRGLWGSDFGSCAFILETSPKPEAFGFFKRLFDKQGEVNSSEELEKRFHDNENRPPFRASARRMLKIPGQPIAYWVSEAVAEIFLTSPPLNSVGKPRQGLATGDNERFLRDWWECSLGRIGFGCTSRNDAMVSARRWFPCNKGGAFRKWYGNHQYIVDWEHDGERIRNHVDEDDNLLSRPQNLDYSFREGMTWSTVTIAQLSMRLSPSGHMFETKGSVCFFDSRAKLEFGLAFANTVIVDRLLLALSPTADYHEGPLGKLPFVIRHTEQVCEIARKCIDLARTDWDNFETSWDFRELPLLRAGLKAATLPATWQRWKAQCDAAIKQMQELETENNRLFIDAYGLQDELKPEVPEDQITLGRADAKKDMAAFVSYAVGCMFGRYSLDKPGLVLASTGETIEDYRTQVPQPTFPPDADNILPVLDGEWFADDIVARFKKFLKLTFGEEQFEENLAFVEESLGKDIRKYFLNDFYKNHYGGERGYGYKKRPIYWMFSSPRKSFNALIYMHRYNRDTVNLLLNDYLREFQVKLRARKDILVQTTLREDVRAGERTRAQKEITKIDAVLAELTEWERDVILPLANKRLEIDLDDGVKVNYLKFGAALQPIPGLDKKEED